MGRLLKSYRSNASTCIPSCAFACSHHGVNHPIRSTELRGDQASIEVARPTSPTMANTTHDGLDDAVIAQAVAVHYPAEKDFEDKKDPLYAVDYSQTDANSEVIPNEEEQHTLRRVADTIPAAAWLLVLVECCERFSWYGTTGPFTSMWMIFKVHVDRN